MKIKSLIDNIIRIGYIQFIIFLFCFFAFSFMMLALTGINECKVPKTTANTFALHCEIIDIFNNSANSDFNFFSYSPMNCDLYSTQLSTFKCGLNGETVSAKNYDLKNPTVNINNLTAESEENASIAFAKQSVYAKIVNENVYMYSQPVNNDFYKVFCIPKTFFVLLSDNAGDAQNLFYKAKYLDFNGYVKKSEVLAVSGTPIMPFAQATFQTFAPNGLELRSSPSVSTQENVIVSVPFLEENLTYYGKTVGEIMVPALGNVWYYCKYLVGSSVYYQGYLYSALCYNLTNFSENEENLPEFQGEIFPVETDAPPVDNEIKLSNELKIIIIICACLPCLFIIYLLFKPTKLIVDNGPNQKKKMKRLKKSEYYEYDDN